ncbi:MAG: hypothetical protein HN576_04675 [Bacteriovoracaceae bacterium]|nr:hypothetical protein [Bacteriovoracaceae bacterium]
METIIKQEEATKLRVVVSREDSEVVNLTFPIYTLSVLDTIIPEKIVEKINLLDINLKEKIQQIKDSGNKPQTIFEMSNNERSYKIWTE